MGKPRARQRRTDDSSFRPPWNGKRPLYLLNSDDPRHKILPSYVDPQFDKGVDLNFTALPGFRMTGTVDGD